MKQTLLLLCLLFSTLSFADSGLRYTSEDFDLFPLTTSNSELIVGTWVGQSVIIQVEQMNFTIDENKPYMWVTIINKKNFAEKSALLYYHLEHGTYELFVFDSGVSVPLELMIFKYTDRVAIERNMKCAKGGHVMRIRFALTGDFSQEVRLQRETCSAK